MESLENPRGKFFKVQSRILQSSLIGSTLNFPNRWHSGENWSGNLKKSVTENERHFHRCRSERLRRFLKMEKKMRKM